MKLDDVGHASHQSGARSLPDHAIRNQLPPAVDAAWGGLRAAPFAALLVDRHGLVRAANAAAHLMWQACGAASLEGRRLADDLLVPDAGADIDTLGLPAAAWSGSARALRLDGTTVGLDAHYYPLAVAPEADGFAVFVAQLSRHREMPASQTDGWSAQAMPSSRGERFQLLVEHAPIEIWVLGANARIEYVNAAACNSLGMTAAALIGQSIHEIDTRPLAAGTREDPVMVLGYTATFEAAHRHADGHAVPKAIVCSVFEVEGRRFIGSFARDITERLAAAAVLQARESQLNAVLEAFPGIVAAFSDNCRPLYVNEALCRMFNKTRQEVLAMTADKLLGTERMAGIRETITRLGQGETVHTERTVHTEHGGETILRTRFAMQDDPLRPGCKVYFAFGTDVTELRQEQRRLASFVAGTRTATWEWSPRDGALSVNAQFAELTGYALAEAKSGVCFWLPLVHAPYRAQRKALMMEVLAGRADGFECEYQATHKSGKEFWVLERAKVMRSAADGSPTVIFGTLQDISRLRRTDAELNLLLQELEDRVARRTSELREASAAAERASRAKSEFLSFMSHELRTPLNAISGFGQLLSMSNLDVEQGRHVGEVMTATDLLVRLIDDLLDLSAIEAGRVPLTPILVPIDDLVSRSLGVIRAVADRCHVQLHVEDLPPGLNVWADRRRLKQVLLNLATNGAKYNRRGGTMTISARRRGSAQIELSVTDQGAGIPDDQLDRLFEPFERLAAAGGPVEGTGIGLTICKRLVQLMQGSIEVESTLGVGSTFRVVLPAASGTATDTADLRDAAAGAVGAHAGQLSRPSVVLYVEDDPASGRLVERALKLLPNVQLHVCADPIAAIEAAASLRPDLLLLDLGLPGMSGAVLLGRLREKGVEAPALAVSALASKADVESTLAAGFQAHVKKPIDVVDLLSRIKVLVGSSTA